MPGARANCRGPEEDSLSDAGPYPPYSMILDVDQQAVERGASEPVQTAGRGRRGGAPVLLFVPVTTPNPWMRR